MKVSDYLKNAPQNNKLQTNIQFSNRYVEHSAQQFKIIQKTLQCNTAQ